MKTINISKQQKERARVRFEFDRLQNSIMEGGGNLAGALGEIIVHDVFTEKGFKVLYNTKQKCDFYFFVAVTEDYKKAFLYGYIKPKEFYQKAKFYKKGEKKEKFVFRCDSYEMKIKDLNQFQK